MRTLKKVLALSLVFAMAFTMMAGAAFKDQDKIDSALTNDIQLLTALGVFQGDENGNFNPTDNVRRSEAAKMIYVLKNNGVDDGAVAFQGVSKYSDVPVGHWAEGYINYCTNLGYMGGWQENGVQKFDPNGNVTGVELMKMLLCMIGYKADVQGYTGNGWQTNVLVDAATSGLSANFIPSVYGATPRQWTARLMTNAIDAEWVAYSKGELTYQGDSYGSQFLKLVTVEGTLTATNHNKIDMTSSSSGTIDDALNDVDYVTVTDSSGKEHSAVGDADATLLGQPVKMYYKHGNNLTEPKLYAVLPYSKTEKVVTTTVDAVKVDDNGKITVEGLGTKAYDTETARVYANGVLLKANQSLKDIKKDGYLGVNSNDTVTLVANSNNTIQKILIHSITGYAQVDKIDASKNTLSFKKLSSWAGNNTNLLAADGTTKLYFNNGENNKENFNKYLNVSSDVKNGDVVKVVANLSSGKLVYDITPVTKIEATPSAYTLNDKNNAYATLTVNGEVLKLAGSGNALNGYDWTTATNTTLTSDKVFYTDGNYVVFSEGGTTSASVSNLAYLIKEGVTGGWNSKNMVKVLLADGTVAEYEYKNDETKDSGGSNNIYLQFAELSGKKDNVYLYEMDGEKIKFKALPTSEDPVSKITWSTLADTKTMNFSKSNATVSVQGAGTYQTDDSTFFFVRTGDKEANYKYSVVKASEMAGNMKTTGKTADPITYATKTINGFPTMLYGVIKSDKAAVSDQVYAFGNGNVSYIGMEGDKYVVAMTANVNGKDETLKWAVPQAQINSQIEKLSGFTGKVFTYTLGADGYVSGDPTSITLDSTTGIVADSWNKVALTAWNGNSAYITKSVASGETELVNVASDVKIHYVDSDSDYDGNGETIVAGKDVVAVSDGSVVVANDKLTKTATNGNAVVYVKSIDNKTTITEIFVEIDGMDIGTLSK